MSQQNVEQQFLQWYDDYGDALYRYCYFKVHDREVAKDLVQETFTRTWQYLSKGYVIEYGRAFLYRVALHCIIRRSQKPVPLSLETLEEEHGFSVAEEKKQSFDEMIDAHDVALLLNTLLDEKDREAIVLRYINELSPREIAHITGESENVISVRLHRALKKFRKKLEEQGYEKIT